MMKKHILVVDDEIGALKLIGIMLERGGFEVVEARDAYAALEEWKPAKEVLGKYRVRFPRDPWGFSAGAEVTRRDPNVKDPGAVQRAVELLQDE